MQPGLSSGPGSSFPDNFFFSTPITEPDGTLYTVRIRGTGNILGISSEQSYPLRLIAGTDSDDLPDTWETARANNLWPYTAETTEVTIIAAVPATTIPISGSLHLYGLANQTTAVVPVDPGFVITGISRQTTPSPAVTLTGSGQPGGWTVLNPTLPSAGTVTTYTDTSNSAAASRGFTGSACFPDHGPLTPPGNRSLPVSSGRLQFMPCEPGGTFTLEVPCG